MNDKQMKLLMLTRPVYMPFPGNPVDILVRQTMHEGPRSSLVFVTCFVVCFGLIPQKSLLITRKLEGSGREESYTQRSARFH